MTRQFCRSAILAVLVLSLSALLAGCGTPGRSYAKTGMQETLEIDILRNNSKMFVYERLQQNAAYVVKHMNYCRDGYIELDRSISRYHLWLKGECKESANAADRQQFAGQEILAVNPDI